MKSLKACTVTVMSNNLEESIHFYCELLGLKLIQNYGGHYAEIQAPGLKIGLHPGTAAKKEGSTSIGFGVTQFDQEVESLKLEGIEMEVRQDGPIRLASFQDPDGNSLFLAEIK